jgi:transposase
MVVVEDRRIAIFDRKIETVFKASEVCQRIAKFKGVGPKTATAIGAAVGDGAEFKTGGTWRPGLV